MNTYFPLLLPLLSVLIGYVFALFLKPEAKKNLKSQFFPLCNLHLVLFWVVLIPVNFPTGQAEI